MDVATIDRPGRDMVEQWQGELHEVVERLTPWTVSSTGVPAVARLAPQVGRLIGRLDRQVADLSRLIAGYVGILLPVPSYDVELIDRHLSALRATAETLDAHLSRLVAADGPPTGSGPGRSRS
jgi:hypothetical protein